MADTSSTPATGSKRKRTPGVKFYAVRTGKVPGIYHTWTECLEQVRGFRGAMFKSFSSLTEAEAFVAFKADDPATRPSPASGKAAPPSKYYAVQAGRVPGVYTDWQEVREQITGWKAPKHKSFKTRGEAEAFVAEGGDGGEEAPATKKNKTRYAAWDRSEWTSRLMDSIAPDRRRRRPEIQKQCVIQTSYLIHAYQRSLCARCTDDMLSGSKPPRPRARRGATAFRRL